MLISDVEWDVEKPKQQQQQQQVLQQVSPPLQQQQQLPQLLPQQLPPPIISSPPNWVFQQPPQPITPQVPVEQVDVVGEVNHMLNQTEQYLLQQIAELHRSSQNLFNKSLAAHEKIDLQDLPHPSKPYLIALIVLVCVLLLFVVIFGWKLWNKISKISTPHSDLFL